MPRATYSITLSIATLSLLALVSEGAHAEFSKKRRSGLWEITIQADATAPSHTVKECVDSANDEQMMKMGNQMSQSFKEGCAKNEIKETVDGFEIYSECQAGPSKMTSRGHFSGDFNSSYKGEIATSFQPPMFGREESKVLITALHRGQCPAGMKPGDVDTGLGRRVNARDIAQQGRQLSDALKNGALDGAFGNEEAGDIGTALSEIQKNLSPDELQEIQKAMRQMGGGGR